MLKHYMRFHCENILSNFLNATTTFYHITSNYVAMLITLRQITLWCWLRYVKLRYDVNNVSSSYATASTTDVFYVTSNYVVKLSTLFFDVIDITFSEKNSFTQPNVFLKSICTCEKKLNSVTIEYQVMLMLWTKTLKQKSFKLCWWSEQKHNINLY